MTKYFVLILIFASISYSFIFLKRQQRKERELMFELKSFYDLKVNSIDGKEIQFSQFKGKKVLCVNVASKCGFTPQYEKLQALSEKYKDKLVVIGFPCNQFLNQESGSTQEIKEFCTKNYGVTFTLTEKIEVKGNAQHEVYEWLTNKMVNGKLDSEVKWNFQKYVIDEKGQLINFFSPKTDPMDAAIIAAIEQ
ncbi:MAG: glutathione peroxidase [Bacteroidetes bacterium]|nr:glutathione peroxidase [Bacteroidota bacterium]